MKNEYTTCNYTGYDMLYKWPSHSICYHASLNASSCIYTVPTTGTDAHWVIWPSDAWSRPVCGYIVPEKYYEATCSQLCNQKKKRQPWNSVSERLKSSKNFSSTPTHFAQMASTVACHIVLPQGCAAADMKENLFVGLSACCAESLFKHTLIRWGAQVK